MEINKIYSLRFSAFIILILSLIVSTNYLPHVLALITVGLLLLSRKLDLYLIILSGLLLYLFHKFMEIDDIRIILPFLFIIFVKSISRNSIIMAGDKIIIAILFWFALILLFSFLTITAPGFENSKFYNYFFITGADVFSYDIYDKLNYRNGSIYFNPNQLSYVFMSLALVLNYPQKKTLLILFIGIAILTISQSRTLLFFLIVYFFGFLYRSEVIKMQISLFNAAFIFFTASLIYILILGGMDSRINSTLTESIDHFLYKFILIDQLFNLDDWAIIFGSGYNRDLHFDADFGSMLYYYGVLIASLLFIICFYSLKRIIHPELLLIFLGLVLYGTMITNSRVVAIFGAFAFFKIAYRNK